MHTLRHSGMEDEQIEIFQSAPGIAHYDRFEVTEVLM